MNLYIHKKSGNVYKVIKYGICKDRDVEVVIYADSQGKYYTREKGEFLKKFVKKEKKEKRSKKWHTLAYKRSATNIASKAYFTLTKT